MQAPPTPHGGGNERDVYLQAAGTHAGTQRAGTHDAQPPPPQEANTQTHTQRSAEAAGTQARTQRTGATGRRHAESRSHRSNVQVPRVDRSQQQPPNNREGERGRERQTDRETDRQTDRERDREIGRERERQRDKDREERDKKRETEKQRQKGKPGNHENNVCSFFDSKDILGTRKR